LAKKAMRCDGRASRMVGWLARMKSARIGIAMLLGACAAKAGQRPTPPEIETCESAVLQMPSSGPARFDAFLAAYVAAAPAARDDLVATFVAEQQAHGGFPIVDDDGTAAFVYVGNGSEHDVRVVGDFRSKSFFKIDWDRSGLPLARAVDGGGLWFVRARFAPDARFDYHLVVDERSAPDRLNLRTTVSGIADGPASELVMPRVETPVLRSDVPHGSLTTIEEGWAHPKITVYTPPAYGPHRRYSVVYTADGSAWRDLIRLPAILDDMIARGAIGPTIAVMIDAADDRSAWYMWNPDYLTYLDKVVAYVDSHYSTAADASHRIHVGTSAGGRASLQVAVERPRLFSNVALLSPGLQVPMHLFEPYFTQVRQLSPALRVWLSAGRYEGAICEDTRTMARWMHSRGVPMKFVFTHEGHSFGTWRHVVPEMLAYFLGSTCKAALNC
jgi:enterochelin esterase-like enzyme